VTVVVRVFRIAFVSLPLTVLLRSPPILAVSLIEIVFVRFA
jgi:hypothetical protein